MTHKLLALAAAGAFALAGAAYAAEPPAAGTPSEVAPAGTAKTTTMPMHTTTTHMAAATATAPIAPAVPFKGVAHSFKSGTDNKSVLVENKAGEWFNLTLSSECKALDGAKSVKLSQGAKSPAGRIYVGKKSCKVASFARATAPEGTTPTEQH